jgi:transposase
MAKRQLKLTEQEANQIRRSEMQSQDVHEHQRLQALRLYGTGMATAEILDTVNCSQRSIQRWVKRYREKGIEGLKSGWDGQNAAKLSPQQRAEIKQHLQHTSPEQVLAADIRIESGQFWTVSDLRIAVQQWYSVVYKSDDSYRNLLHESRLSYQQTEKVYRSRPSEQAIADFEAELEKK